QAERFFGNRMAAGSGVWIDVERWRARRRPREVPDGTPIVLGFDGSDIDDWTGFRAETEDGYQFTPTYGPLRLPTVWDPAEWGGQVPRQEVRDALSELMARYRVVRLYADPPYWSTEIDEWAAEYGNDRVIRWYTHRPPPAYRRHQGGVDANTRRVPDHRRAHRGGAQGGSSGWPVQAGETNGRPEDRYGDCVDPRA